MARRRRCRTASALCAHGLGALQAGVQFGLRRLLRGPALHMLLGDAAQRRDPGRAVVEAGNELELLATGMQEGDRKSTRLNSSHLVISYAVFCLKKQNEAHVV